MITAVDLLKGMANLTGMKIYEVEGATGNLDTNFSGKAEAAVTAFKDGYDLVYLHLEAPDECGHRHEVEGKIQAIEKIDELVLGPVLSYLKEQGEFGVLITPDHPTPLTTRKHSNAPGAVFDLQNRHETAASVQRRILRKKCRGHRCRGRKRL